MSTRAVLQVFENYQKARVSFVQTIAELAQRPQNIEALQNAGVMQLLRPLLLDNVPSIQHSAAIALGRLAGYNDELAEAVVSGDILPQLVYSLSEQNRFYKRAAAFVLDSVAKHSEPLAQNVVDSGAIDSLVTCLEEFDPSVKEAAIKALSSVAQHAGALAQAVVDGGSVPLLVLALQEAELSLKTSSAVAMSNIAKHSPELAQAVVDAGAIAYLAPLIQNPDAKLKRAVCSCLAQIAKHSVDLAELVTEGEIFPKVFTCLKDVDTTVRKNAATLIREIAKHTPELANLITTTGGVSALVEYISESKGNARLPGIMALGYIGALTETMAMAIISSKGLPPLLNALVTEPEDHIRSAAAWALGQIGHHSPDHAKALAETQAFPKLLAIYRHEASSDDLKNKSKRALKAVLQKCVHLPALEPLLHDAPPNVLKYVVEQFSKVLPNDIAARRAFVTSGGLQKLQQINAEPGSKLQEYIDAINSVYPPEIVKYYSPGYSQTLLDAIDQFQPA